MGYSWTMAWNHAKITDWLLSVGPDIPDLEALTLALADRFAEDGVPLLRVRLAMRTVHPLMTAVSTIWDRDAATNDVFASPHGLEQRSAYAGSPMARIIQTRAPVRQDLTALTSDDHVAFLELRARGATDYFGLPLRFGDHLSGIMIFVTDAADGFSADHIRGFCDVALATAPLVEVMRLTVLSEAVATSYLGPGTAKRVLGGEITRGHVDHLDAAILISDLRGWTRMNTDLPVEETVAIANAYFDLLDTAVRANDGEILKFMGDGVLAIFPATDNPVNAAQNALRAALEASSLQTQELRFGIGLHLGDVLYGNIGSERRLDFTVMGQAVNLAARIEALCTETGQTILMSEDFARRVSLMDNRLGPYAVKGVRAPIPVFFATETTAGKKKTPPDMSEGV